MIYANANMMRRSVISVLAAAHTHTHTILTSYYMYCSSLLHPAQVDII